VAAALEAPELLEDEVTDGKVDGPARMPCPASVVLHAEPANARTRTATLNLRRDNCGSKVEGCGCRTIAGLHLTKILLRMQKCVLPRLTDAGGTATHA
jgi:hypothetical protein